MRFKLAVAGNKVRIVGYIVAIIFYFFSVVERAFIGYIG